MTGAASARLILDEMFGGSIADQLRIHGIDAVTVVEDPTLVSRTDEEVLERATAARRAVVTADVTDFAELAARWRIEGRRHLGIVFVPQRAFPQNRALNGRIVAALIAVLDAGLLPAPGTEMFLRRAD